MDSHLSQISPQPNSPNLHYNTTNAFNSQSFTHKLFDMVSDPAYSHIIKWSNDGLSFEVIDPKGMETEILPKYFRHDRFASMVRQLNFYNFKKIGKERSSWIYQHNFFQRNKPELLLQLKRKTNGSSNLYSHDSDDLGDHLFKGSSDYCNITLDNTNRKRAYSIQSDNEGSMATTPNYHSSPFYTSENSTKIVSSILNPETITKTSSDILTDNEEPSGKRSSSIYDSWNPLSSVSFDFSSSVSTPISTESHIRDVFSRLVSMSSSMDNTDNSSDCSIRTECVTPVEESISKNTENQDKHFISLGMRKNEDIYDGNASESDSSVTSKSSKSSSLYYSSNLSNLSISYNLVNQIKSVFNSSDLTLTLFLSLLELLNKLFPYIHEGRTNPESCSNPEFLKSFEKNLLSNLSKHREVAHDLAIYMEYLNYQIEKFPLLCLIINGDTKSVETLDTSINPNQSQIIVEQFVRNSINTLNIFIDYSCSIKIYDQFVRRQFASIINSLKSYENQLILIHNTFN